MAGDAQKAFKDQVWTSTGYVPVRAHRCRLIISALRRHMPLAGRAIADIGCASGILVRALADLGARATGLEPDGQLCAAAEKFCAGKARILNLTVGQAAALPDRFDAAVLSEVLEHIDDDRAALNDAAALLKPGGLLLVTVPINPAFWSPVDETDGHLRRYEPGRLVSLVQGAGLEVLGTGRFHWLYYRAQQAYTRLTRRGFYSESVFGGGALPPPWVRLAAALVFALDGLFSALGLGAHMLLLARKGPAAA